MTRGVSGAVQEIRRVLLAVFFGLVMTTFFAMCLGVLDEMMFDSNSNLELEERLPAWWLLTWPAHLWSHVLSTDSLVFVATALTHVCVFSAASYLVLRHRPRPLGLD
jgi:ABC-type spermidine/putrescine transport system permease subunit I